MEEVVISIKPSEKKNKKYKAFIASSTDNKIRVIHFGDKRYQHYKDTTPNKTFSFYDHLDNRRRRNYFMRFSNTPNKIEALDKEINKSEGKFTAKILSHYYLW